LVVHHELGGQGEVVRHQWDWLVGNVVNPIVDLILMVEEPVLLNGLDVLLIALASELIIIKESI